MTPLQTKIIHIAKKQAALTDEEYRQILADTAGVGSSKDLDNDGFENVMAVIEGLGFRERGKPGDYWRRRVNLKGEHIDSRVAWKIRELAEKSPYELAGLVWRHSHHRTREVELLYPPEAYEVIEMLKSSNARNAPEDLGKSRAVPAPKHVPVTDEEIPF